MKHEAPQLDRAEIEYLIEQKIIGRNAERNRRILYRRLIDGICYEKLAEEFALTDRRVKDICYKEIQKLF